MKRFLLLLLTPCLAAAVNFKPDVPTDLKNQFNLDLTFVQTLAGNGQSALHGQVYGDLSGNSYSRFFNSRIRTVGLSDCGNPNAVACVIPMMSTSTMWVTPNFTKFNHPQIARLMVIFHEARHTEIMNGFWGHATCPTPFNDKDGNPMKSIFTGAPLAGEPACDTRALGAYGSSTIMLKNISKRCTNCGQKVMLDAELYADDQLGRITGDEAKQTLVSDFAAL